MKNLSSYSNYIIGFVLFFLISTTGYLIWENNSKNELLLSELSEVKDPSQLKGKEKYAYYQALYNKYQGWSKKDLKKIAKKDRPDLAMLQDYLRTANPNTGDIPENARIKANEFTDLRLNALSQNQRAIAGVNWIERGPNDVGGRTRALMYDPNDATGRKVWAGGVGGGLWYTNDITVANPTWVAVDNFWENIAISSIAYDPSNTQNMYVSTGEGFFGGGMQRGAGIWKTTDGGANWARLANTSPTVTDDFQYVQKIVVTPTGTLLAACRTDGFNSTSANSGGIFRSADGGTNWVKVTLPETSTRAADLEVAADGTLYGTTALFGGVVGSIYKSTNDGVNWTEVTPAGISANTRRIEIASAPSNSDILYAVAHDASTNNIAFFKKSINAGVSWTDVTIPLYRNQGGCATNGTQFTRGQAWYDLILQVNPTNPNHVVVGGIDVHRTTDGGANWTSISYWTGECGPYVHADIHAFAYKPGSSDEMLVGSDGGVSYSANIQAGTPAFNDRNSGYNVTQFYAVAMNPNNGSNYLLGGTQDNGTRKLTSAGVGGSTQPTGGDGAFCFIDQDNPNIQISSYVFNNFYVSTNGGGNFIDLGAGDNNTGEFINPADYHDDLDLLYSSSKGNRNFARWTVPGGTRNDYNVTGMTGDVTHLKASPFTAASTTLYIGTSAGEVVRVPNANAGGGPNKTGTVLSNGTMQTQGSVSSIEFGTSENQMVVTYSNYGAQSVWYTDDGGTSWTSKDTAHGLPDMPVRWAMFNPNNTNEVLIATETGVWSTDDITAGAAGDFWELSSTGLANTRCDMFQIRSSDNLVAVATHGRGIFTTNVFSPAAADFSADKDLVYMNKDVIFTDASAGATSWDWNFDAGASTATANTTGPHTISYSTPGIKTITLSINGGGGVLTTTRTITVLPDRPVPYAITDGGNFDVNPLDFAADNVGGATMWERGNSATAGKNGTASGANAWVTGLTGDYLNNSHSNLYAPNFDFSAAGTYNLSFETKHVYETGYDGMIVEYSTDRGTSWTKLGTATTGAAWYNSVIGGGPDPTVFGPSGTPFMSATNANYFTKSLDVSSLAGNLDVAFRIVFKSDVTITDVGAAVDNFLITFVPAASPATALDFDGNNDLITIATPTNLPTGNDPYTIELWFKPILSGVRGVIGWGNAVNNQANAIEVNINTSLRIRHYWWANDIDIPLTDLSGNWYHYAATYDGTTRSVYVNGELQKSDVPGVHNVPASSTLFIGRGLTNGNYEGALDEIRIWSTARTCSEIKANMNNELIGTEAGLVTYYNFNQGLAAGNNAGLTTLNDLTSSNNDGTLTGFSLAGATSNWIDGSANGVSGTVATPQQEINLLGNSVSIVDGDATPNVADNTDFGTVVTDRLITYTIENTGTADLAISSIVSSGTNAGDFVISNITLPATIMAGNSITFDVTFTPSGAGTRTATITVNNDDCDEAIYDFAVQGIQSLFPEINVQGNGNNIVSGTGTTSPTNDTDFGGVAECGTNNLAKTYTIQNTGGAALTVNNITVTGTNAADFTLSGLPAFPATVAATTGTQTFTVTFDPSATGNRAALVTITNDDADENPYTFAINGNGTADNVAPVVPTLADVTAECSSTPTAPTTTDNCVGTVTGTTGTIFPITAQGTTVVTWTFDDGNGNTSTADQNVILNDVTAPVVPTLADVTAECSSTPTAPTTTDNCVGTVTGTTGTIFPITAQGTTVVTWTFDDGNGNTSTADQNVILNDITAPVVPTLADVTAECSSTPTAPTTTDNCVGTVTGTTGTIFPITAQGTTVVTWTFDDGNGNTSTADQNVILNDITAPVVPTLADVTAECSATPTAPTTTDNCVGTVTGTTGTIFPITAQGTTVVTWTFDDGNGNTSTADQNVILNDVTNPTITAPTNVIVNTDVGACTASGVALGTPTGTDNCGTPTFTNDATPPFSIGNTTVTWTADDGNGNTVTATQTVTVNSTREIDVLGNSVSITDGDVTPDVADDTDFGNTTLRTITYTIENTGTEALTISSIISSGTNSGDFVVSNVPAVVAASGTATFDVTFTPSGGGTKNATITINNNDCDEAAYDFAVEGINTSSGDVLLVRTGVFYPTIQQAVDAAIANDVIEPQSARLYDENVVVDKNLTFTSPTAFTDYTDINIDGIKVNTGISLIIDGYMSINKVLEMEGTAQMTVNTGQDFALRSTTDETALLINGSTTNTIVGTVIMERYLPAVSDVGGTDGLGYHLFSSPFSDATVSQFGDDMGLVLTTAYNTAPEPAFVRPFPTFFQYEETNAGAVTSAYYNPFISNYKVPTTANLTAVRGYQANIATGVTVDLNGTLNNGNQSIAVTNSGGGFSQEGYNLIGNPYPSPIDWELVLAASTGLEDAVYIDIPVNQYQGVFAEYVNGVSNNGGKKEIASMQGFFVRTTAGGTVNMNNGVRLTTDTRFFKTTETENLKEGLIRVALKSSNSLDETTVYFQAGATTNFDGKYDAAKLHKMNATRSTLYSYNENEEGQESEYFAINGLGSFKENQTLPLAMNILKDGDYEITLRSMKYFHSKHELYLYDSLTDSLHNLKAEGDYKFEAKKGYEIKRFVLLFKTDASQDFFENEKLMVYPNPTPNSFSYSLKTDREGAYTIRLFDATGRVIFESEQSKEGAFLEGTIDLEKHASGLYLLQVSDADKTMTVRIVKE
ncbi:choice-of-anchor D domain-containing protein [Bernardetia sp. ABR2-2B]|uniref:choice-of-anchor D domain-containing protein n=1 Tax=Bernardetia sp. ABR2-2B TaxID=3127472 RepID=UPI0030D60706